MRARRPALLLWPVFAVAANSHPVERWDAVWPKGEFPKCVPCSGGLVLPDGPMDALVRQVLAEGGCSFRRLGLEPGAPPEAVRKRYLQLALRMHPDKASHARAQEAFTALESAYSAAHAGLP